MLGPAFLQYFGITPETPWTEWKYSLAFVVIATLVLRLLLWVAWPRLIRDGALRKAGWYVDGFLLCMIANNFYSLMPVPIFGNHVVNFLMKAVFLTLGFRFLYSALELMFSSSLFANWNPILLKRLRTLGILLLFVFAYDLILSAHTRTWLFDSWVFLAIVVGFVYASLSCFKNIIDGLMLIKTQGLQIGSSIDIEGVSGTIENLSWTHVELKSPDQKKILIPYSQLSGQCLYKK